MKNKKSWCPISFLGGERKDSSAYEHYKNIAWLSSSEIEELWNNEAELYGMAGHVINAFWEEFKTLPEFDSPIIQNNSIKNNKWRLFNYSCTEKLDGHRMSIYQNIYERNVHWDIDNSDLVAMMYILRKSDQLKIEWIPAPSFIDFIVFFSACAEVVEKLWWDVEEVMKHKNTKSIFSQMMSNNRAFLHPFFGILEGAKDMNPEINDEYRKFLPNLFSIITDEKEASFLSIKPNITQKYKDIVQKTLTLDTTTPVPPTYTCPLLYSWLTNQVYSWLLQELKKIEKEATT